MEDAVAGNVDGDEFGAAWGGGDEGPVRGEGAAGVEDPEAVLGVEDYALDADEVVGVVCADGWGHGVVDCSVGWVVDVYIWIRDFRSVG